MIAVDVTEEANWKEIRSLALFSYRHFATAKLLKKLDEGESPPSQRKRASKKKAS